MDSVYSTAAAWMRTRRTGALAVVTGARGHTPQVVGATLLVGPSEQHGTVGGGRVEHEVTLECRRGGPARLVEYALGAELGMCCGGVMEVLITPLEACGTWLEQWTAARRDGRALTLLTSLEADNLGERRVATSAEPLGERRFEHAGEASIEGRRHLVEHVAAPPRFVLFGAGHVAQPTAHLAHRLGYDVWVIDDREQWNNPSRFPNARRIRDPYEDALAEMAWRDTDAALIVTQGHDFDQQILSALVTRNLWWLGMIGSKAKVHRAFQRLRAEKVPESLIARVNAPVGLSLGALTPEEIGVSIAAQLVRARRS